MPEKYKEITCGLQIFLKNKLMSTNDTKTLILNQPEKLSKREQMKLNQTLKLIQTQNNSNDKHAKRNAHHYRKTNDPTPRKILKTQTLSNSQKSDDPSSSIREQEKNVVQQNPIKEQFQEKHEQKSYNTAYSVPEGEEGLFNYMIDYSYREKEKLIEMESLEWEGAQTLGGQTVQSISNQSAKIATKKAFDKFTEKKQKLDDIFCKQHRDFTKKFINTKYLLS